MTDQCANFRNQYLSHKDLKTGFGISLSQTVDWPHSCPRSPRTGSATGCVGRSGVNPPFDLEKFRNQFWDPYGSNIDSWNSQINPRSDQQPYRVWTWNQSRCDRFWTQKLKLLLFLLKSENCMMAVVKTIFIQFLLQNIGNHK